MIWTAFFNHPIWIYLQMFRILRKADVRITETTLFHWIRHEIRLRMLVFRLRPTDIAERLYVPGKTAVIIARRCRPLPRPVRYERHLYSVDSNAIKQNNNYTAWINLRAYKSYFFFCTLFHGSPSNNLLNSCSKYPCWVPHLLFLPSPSIFLPLNLRSSVHKIQCIHIKHPDFIRIITVI